MADILVTVNYHCTPSEPIEDPAADWESRTSVWDSDYTLETWDKSVDDWSQEVMKKSALWEGKCERVDLMSDEDFVASSRRLLRVILEDPSHIPTRKELDLIGDRLVKLEITDRWRIWWSSQWRQYLNGENLQPALVEKANLRLIHPLTGRVCKEAIALDGW